MNINIDYQARTPIYEQIVTDIENKVSLGILKPNEQLPSIRDLAINLSINPNTVKKSYDILEKKNVITIRSTKGAFISDNIEQVINNKTAELFNNIEENIKKLENLGLSKEKIIKRIKEL